MGVSRSVKSALRVLEILEHFKEVREPLRLTDVAARLRYPVSSAAALLKTMVEQGYLHCDPAVRTYFPTPRLKQLTDWMPAAGFEQGPVRDAMHRLQRSTGEMVVLGTPDDIHIEYVDTLRSTRSEQLYNPPGTRRLIVQTGMGWLMLSRMPRAAALAIHRRTIALGELTEREFSRAALLARMDEMRRQDFSATRATDYVRPTAHWGGGMIAMLVPTPARHRVLAIGIGGPARRLDANRADIIGALRAEMTRLRAESP